MSAKGWRDDARKTTDAEWDAMKGKKPPSKLDAVKARKNAAIRAERTKKEKP